MQTVMAGKSPFRTKRALRRQNELMQRKRGLLLPDCKLEFGMAGEQMLVFISSKLFVRPPHQSMSVPLTPSALSVVAFIIVEQQWRRGYG